MEPNDGANEPAGETTDPVDSSGQIDADAAIVQGDEPPSARVALDRRRIIDTALEHIEDSGLPSLTMRRLGTRLGVEAMSLYNHVPGKEELLDGIVEALIGDMRPDPDVLAAPESGWQDFLQRLAHGVRRVALAHPKSFPLVASRPPEAPWLRPPLRSLEWVETFLSGLRASGFSDDAAVASYRAFTSFLLGHLLLEASSMGADIGPLDTMDDGEADDERLHDFPTVTRLQASLREDHAAAEFEEALEELLNRIATIKVEL